jgi:uncharacterized RDD family membrane protein YckC
MVDTRNPYAAPQADGLPIGVFDTDLDLKTATQGTRVVNFILDSIFRQVAAVVAMLISAPLHEPAVGMVLMVLTIFGYYVVFEAATGRTPAKYITNTRVVDMMGGKPSLGQILGRSAARFIPFEPFSFLGSTQRGWHDSLSRTRVVKL